MIGLTTMTVLAVLNGAAMGRIVFLGDSITDGHTYPLLIEQAMSEAGLSPPVVINAGIGGDTARGMLERLDRDVFIHRPDRVTVSAGINDVLRGISPADYEADLERITARLREARVEVILLMPSILGSKHADAAPRLAEFRAGVRRVAQRHHCPVAEVDRLMLEAQSAGQTVLEDDHVHPNYQGQRLIARAVLDAKGLAQVPVPAELKVRLMPGVIRRWRIRAADDAPALDERTVAALSVDESWKAYELPEAQPQPTPWLEQERRRGFALSLDKLAGSAKRYQGMSVVTSPEPRRVHFNTGAQLQTIWLNGERVYRSAGWTGWHAGKERIAVDLRQGENVILIESAGAFFLSMTEDE